MQDENFSISDEADRIAVSGNSLVKSAIGFVKKIRTNVGASQAVIFGVNPMAYSGQTSPIVQAKKQKKHKSIPQGTQSQAQKVPLNAPI